VTVEQPDDEPGDAVCWLHELCPVCGAMPTAEQPDRCWRCGYPYPADASPDSPTRVPFVE
jgi:ribosomal protein S27AE